MKNPDSIKSWQLIPVKDEDIPELTDPPEAVDPELERLLAWFIKRRHRLAWEYGADVITIRPRYESDEPGRDLPGGIMLFKDGRIRLLQL